MRDFDYGANAAAQMLDAEADQWEADARDADLHHAVVAVAGAMGTTVGAKLRAAQLASLPHLDEIEDWLHEQRIENSDDEAAWKLWDRHMQDFQDWREGASR